MDEEIRDCLEGKFKELEQSLVKTMRWYLGFIFGIVILIAGMFSWVAVGNVEQESHISNIEENQRLLIKANYDEHPENLLFKYLSSKYALRRGASNSDKN